MNDYKKDELYICYGITHREGQIIRIRQTPKTRSERVHYEVVESNPEITDHTNVVGYVSRFSAGSHFDGHLEPYEPEDLVETEIIPTTFYDLFRL